MIGPGCDRTSMCYKIDEQADPVRNDAAAETIGEPGDITIGPLQDPGAVAGPAEILAGARRPQRAKYVGHTGTSLHKQMLGHRYYKDAGINKHIRDQHPGNPPQYVMRPLKSSRTNLQRTTAEGILMEKVIKESPGLLMNSKSEGGRGKLVRYVPQVTWI